MQPLIPTVLLSLLITTPALAQPAPKPVPAGTPVTMARPTDADEVLLRLIGIACTATTKLARNADGTFDGTVTCGAVSIKGKRLALEVRGDVRAPDPQVAPGAPAVPIGLPRVESGTVTILDVGPNDLFLGRLQELRGKVCTVTKPLNRDAAGYYAGELTCPNGRFYFAQVTVAAGAASLPPDGVGAPRVTGPQPGERWRIIDAGDVYPSINTTDCLAWPSAETRRKGGQDFWGQAYAPHAGDVGVVLASARHCSQDIDVVILQIGAYVVPIGAQGIERAP